MGIIEDKRKSNRNYNLYNNRKHKTETNENSKILDLTYLKKMIDNVYSHHKTDRKESELKHHRRWSYMQDYRLQNLLGSVDTPTYVFMLEAMLEFAIETRQAIQPNGQWELIDYEYKIEIVEQRRKQTVGRDKDGAAQSIEIKEDVQFLVIALQLVDVMGAEDVQYDMGRPKRQTDSTLTPKMFRELLENQGSKIIEQPTENVKAYQEKLAVQEKRLVEQDKAMSEMQSQMTSMQEMMAGLITELQTAKASDIKATDNTPPKVSKRAKK